LEHPALSSDLAPSDFHLFPGLKQKLGGWKFKDNREVEPSCGMVADSTGH
jgi:hypothetical protein